MMSGGKWPQPDVAPSAPTASRSGTAEVACGGDALMLACHRALLLPKWPDFGPVGSGSGQEGHVRALFTVLTSELRLTSMQGASCRWPTPHCSMGNRSLSKITQIVLKSALVAGLLLWCEQDPCLCFSAYCGSPSSTLPRVKVFV